MESKTIQDYTVYCTPEQAKKALALGAPLETCDWRITNTNKYIELDNEKGWHIQIPTAEQMCGWLRTKGLFVEPYLNGECSYSFSPILSTKEDGEIMRLEAEDEYKKAALAAIDATLDYLEQKKENNHENWR